MDAILFLTHRSFGHFGSLFGSGSRIQPRLTLCQVAMSTYVFPSHPNGIWYHSSVYFCLSMLCLSPTIRFRWYIGADHTSGCLGLLAHATRNHTLWVYPNMKGLYPDHMAKVSSDSFLNDNATTFPFEIKKQIARRYSVWYLGPRLMFRTVSCTHWWLSNSSISYISLMTFSYQE